jgi:serine protease Do
MNSSRPVSLINVLTIASLLALATPAFGSTNLDLARQLNAAFVEVAEKISPTVVVITVKQKPVVFAPVEPDEDSGETIPDELWRYFHEQFRNRPPEETSGQGSGVIIREDGYIMTNRHVVEDAESIQVRLKDGRVFQARIRGVDPQSDVAVLQIDASGLPFAKLADSSKTRVGEFAIAIGAPFQLDYSVTFGHVSAKGRGNVVPFYAGGAIMDQDFIQTDANINPGNSGGPLVNIDGEVIGINTLIRGLRTGIGFAIPSNLAREVSDQLIAHGKFARPWLGVSIVALKDSAEYRELIKGVESGVLISAILPDGPAAKSELRPSDVIAAVDGRAVSTPQDLRNEIRRKTIGQSLTLDVYRPQASGNAKKLAITIKPAEWETEPAEVVAKKDSPAPRETSDTSIGLTVEPLTIGLTVQPFTRDLAEKFGVQMTEGVLVASVEKDSPAGRQGIEPGNVITAVNSQPVASVRQYRNALRKADLKKGVLVILLSGDVARFEILKAEK